MENKEKNEKSVDEFAKEAAEKVMGILGLDKLNERMDAIEAEKKAASDAAVAKFFVAEDVEKPVSEMTAVEKVKAYSRAIMTADHNSLKALSEGVGADGGYTVPQDFYSTLLEQLVDVAQMRSEVTVVPMKTNVLTLTMIDHGPEVAWTAEGATKTTTTADFSQPTITAYKLAAIIYLTDELIDDSAFSLSEILVRRFATKMAEAEDKAIIAGTGTGQPTGLFVATVPSISAGGNLGFDKIIDLVTALPVKYRKNAKFLVNPVNVGELRKLKDSQGRYLWLDSLSPAAANSVLGYPVIESYWVPESQIMFGDYKEAYWLGDRQRMTVKITQDTETAFTQDKTAIRVVERIGGNVVFPDAVRKITSIP